MGLNKARGETRVTLDGVEYTTCLTLGALAEIEAELNVPSLAALGDRLKSASTNDLVTVVMALIRGGGSNVSRETLLALPASQMAALSGLIQATFEAAGMAGKAEDEDSSRPPEATSPRGDSGLPPESLRQSAAA